MLARFVKAGGQVVDSSPMYGSAESVVGDLAADLGAGKSLFLATKVWTSGREAGMRQMEESMRRMRTTRMDLMQVHNLVDVQTQLKTLREWKAQGRIRYLGITHYHEGAYAELERLIKSEQPRLRAVQLQRGRPPRPRSVCCRCARSTGPRCIVNRPFEEGALFRLVKGKELPKWAAEFDCNSWAQFFLKFILSHPGGDLCHSRNARSGLPRRQHGRGTGSPARRGHAPAHGAAHAQSVRFCDYMRLDENSSAILSS